MRSLRYLNTILTLIALLLTLNLWTAWTAGPTGGPVELASPAHAAGVGSGAAREQQMVDELKKLNAAVSALDATLTSGKVRVKLDAPPVN